ncbi:MAG TPA: hypothetical protein DEP53_19530 [Bacteroidetes bacterium]|nr:hypothetical protein [Bacteroidota bacterium]
MILHTLIPTFATRLSNRGNFYLLVGTMLTFIVCCLDIPVGTELDPLFWLEPPDGFAGVNSFIHFSDQAAPGLR